MKRTIFIIAGSVVLLLIFLIWVFLLLFGTPENIEEAFTNLGLRDGATAVDPNANFPLEQTAQLNINAGSLVQLTTKPVAGHGFLGNGSTTNKIIYAERGVGHIYEIDISSGVETRISAKTFLAVTDAVFSRDGQFVAMVSETGEGNTASLESLGDGIDYELPAEATDLEFVSNNELRYTVTNESGTTGYSFDLVDVTTDVVFYTPLSDINTLWSTTDTLIISKSAPRLRGSLFKVGGNQLSQIGESGYALSAIAPKTGTGEYVLTSVDLEKGGVLNSGVFNEFSGVLKPLSLLAWPEKCTFDVATLNTLWCASSASELSRDSQSEWYKGLLSFSDSLWKIDTISGQATLVENLLDASGRNVDVIDLEVDQTGQFLLFKNKLDDSLWLKKL